MGNLFNYQFDFIKVKTQKVDRESVNWEMLYEHPTIKNAYLLSDKSTLFGKNFKLYFDKNNQITLETSVPYLNNNHNYVDVRSSDLHFTFQFLSELLNVDFMAARVLQFEYGVFEQLDLRAQRYIKDVIGVGGYDLKYSSTFMKMFGNSNLCLKIYDAISNAKQKKTFTRGNYPKEKLVKYELKFLNPSKNFKTTITVDSLCSPRFEYKLKSILEEHIDSIIEHNKVLINPKGTSINHFVYAALKNYEQLTGIKATNVLGQLIDESTIDASQKSKRRKSITQLETLYQIK